MKSPDLVALRLDYGVLFPYRIMEELPTTRPERRL